MVPSGWELEGGVGATGRDVLLLESQVAANGKGSRLLALTVNPGSTFSSAGPPPGAQ